MIFGNRGDLAVVLSEIVAQMHSVNDAVGIFDETFDGVAQADRSDHPQAVEREALEWLLRMYVWFRAGALGLRLFLFFAARPKWIAARLLPVVLVAVGKRFERLQYRQSRQWCTFLGLFRRHPF